MKDQPGYSTKSSQAFEDTWSRPTGLKGWLSVVNNQPLGKRFMVTAFVFFLIAGILALLMRTQLISPSMNFLGPHLYNQFFTMHGSIMMFLFVVPFLEGLTLYILPLMIGSRDVAFPRLSAFSYWIYLFGGILFVVSIFINNAPDAGWFAYTPLSGPKYSGLGVDFWVLGLGLVEVSGIATGIEIVVTILKFRAIGMRLDRMPLFVWTMLVTGVMIIFAFTVLLMATFMLESDRMLGTAFFNTDKGGSSLLWQHLFWFFGHPEVYIMFLPATGIVSTIVATFARRPVVAYLLVVTAIIVMGFVSFGLWVHHMFTTGLPELASAFFTAASLIIAVASGIQIFAWIATLWGRKPLLKTPFWFILGFFFIFTLGGLTGVMVAVVPFDWQVHDTYFIVAHFHYVLIGGVVFPIFAAISYWFPKITGKLMKEAPGVISFWFVFIGFNLTFFPMHFMGIMGLPRRVYTYPKELNLGDLNLLATIGAYLMAIGFLIFIMNMWKSLRKGMPASNNPWGASSIEWSISSPPPPYSFLSPPCYLEKEGGFVEEGRPGTEIQKRLTGVPIAWRATLVTDAVNAVPQGLQWLPGPTLFPFTSAVTFSVIFIGLLLKLYLLSAVAGIFFVGFIIKWLWPTADTSFRKNAAVTQHEIGLSVHPTSSQSPLWWGMICFITALLMAIGSQLFSYFYLWLYSSSWPQENLSVPSWSYHLYSSLSLILGWIPIWWAKRKNEKEHEPLTFPFSLFSFLTALVAFAILLHGALTLPFTPQENAYASAVHVIHWIEIAFILLGLGLVLSLLIRIFTEKEVLLHPLELQLQLVHMYWVFLAVAVSLSGIVLCLSPLLL